MEQCHCDLFSKINENTLFTSHLNFMCLLPLRPSCVFLANYVPECQMSSGPCGPIFIYVAIKHNQVCVEENPHTFSVTFNCFKEAYYNCRYRESFERLRHPETPFSTREAEVGCYFYNQYQEYIIPEYSCSDVTVLLTVKLCLGTIVNTSYFLVSIVFLVALHDFKLSSPLINIMHNCYCITAAPRIPEGNLDIKYIYSGHQ